MGKSKLSNRETIPWVKVWRSSSSKMSKRGKRMEMQSTDMFGTRNFITIFFNEMMEMKACDTINAADVQLGFKDDSND